MHQSAVKGRLRSQVFLFPGTRVLLLILLGTIAHSATANTITSALSATASLWVITEPDATATVPLYVVLPSNATGSSLTFSVSGATSRDPSTWDRPLVGPDGETPGTGPFAANWGPEVYENLVGMFAPYQSLAGVFVDESVAVPTAPHLFFGTETERGFSTLSPELQQVFFIGDGLIGVGTGQVQTFTIPERARALFLSTYDSPKGFYNNVGSLTVSITSQDVELSFGDPTSIIPFTVGAHQGVNGIPEPATAALLGAVLVGLSASHLNRRKRSLRSERTSPLVIDDWPPECGPNIS
jgi:hypothetical protein